MRIFLTVILILNMFFGFSNVKPCTWVLLSSEIKKVYTSPNSNGGIEMIRMYKNNQFEHLNYLSNDGSKIAKTNSDREPNYFLEREIGTYTIKKSKLFLEYKVPKTNEIEKLTSYVLEKGKLYENRWQSLFHKEKFRFQIQTKTTIQLPFYMVPTSGEIIANTEAKECLNLTDLVRFITKKHTATNDKINQIANFLMNSLKSNYRDSRVVKSMNEEQLVKNILTGKDRTANSFDFATALKVLSNLAGENLDIIEGRIKKTSGFGYEFVANYWNGLKNDNHWLFYDVSLGIDWTSISPSVMIYSHFPDDTINQHLNELWTWDKFTSTNFIEPVYGVQTPLSFFPISQYLHTNKETKIVLSESPNSIDFFEFDTLREFFKQNSIPVKFSLKQLNHSNIVVQCEGLCKKGKLILHMNSNLSVCYLIVPDELSDNGVDVYLSQFYSDKCVVNENDCKDVGIKSMAELSKVNLKNTRFLNDFKRYNINPLIVSKCPIISEALNYYGIEEEEGEKSNAYISLFFKETGNLKIASDNTAWCSVFVGYCAKKTGYVAFAKANAKSWLKVGKKINVPEPGDIVVFWRESPLSWKGHVAIYIGKDALTGKIICLGGNQNDKVCLSLFSTSNVIGYRRLIKPSS